ANDPATPPELAERLKAIPPPALASHEALVQIEAGIDAGLSAKADEAAAKAQAATLAGVGFGMGQAEDKAIATVDKVDAAMKESFTDAVKHVYMLAIFFALFALLAALPMPSLTLRKTGGPPTLGE
ncbi:MAG TPA: hypothetical protein VGO62_22315, partial [Myxococcota bacterium]